MMLCSVCKKNVAVIFITKIVEGKQEPIGLCMSCAKEKGIAPLNYLMQQSGMSPEDMENLNEQMSSMMEDIDPEELSSMMFGENNENKNPLMNFVNSAFAGLKGSSEGNELDKPNNINEKNVENGKAESAKKEQAKRKNLNQFAINLNEKALNNEVDRIIGREKEISRVIQILNRRMKNNPVLIGSPGVGKTAIAEGLAVRIVQRKVPVKLLDAEIFLLDMAAVVAGTQFRGQFEARMKAIIKEAQESRNVILVIDELHNIVGAGEAEGGALNAANILKPALARGDVQIIGATTLDEYRKHIEKDQALERRFQPVIVSEPSIEDSIEILKGIKDYYENYHKIFISEDVIEAAVKMSERYIHDRFLPDKAIDVIDEAGSKVNLKNESIIELEKLRHDIEQLKGEIDEAAQNGNFKIVSELKTKECQLQIQIKELEEGKLYTSLSIDDVAEVIEAWTNIPVQRVSEEEAKKLMKLEQSLHNRVIGQNEAIKSISKAVRRNRAGFRKKKKPASFIFVGPTGVGKTELARALSTELFGSEEAMIRLDMSEYMEKHTVSKLIGAPPGYVGFDQGGQLTEKVRRRPYSLILLDEIEKAHPDVFNMLLQIMDDGRLTDSQGRTVNFENTVIIMTSNAGTNLKANGIGYSNEGKSAIENKINSALKEAFRPEFLNRVDEIVIFEQLSKEELKEILEIMLKEVFEESGDKSISVIIEEGAKEFLLNKGYDNKYGARPLRRTIQKYIEDELAERYLLGQIKNGDTVTVKEVSGELLFNN